MLLARTHILAFQAKAKGGTCRDVIFIGQAAVRFDNNVDEKSSSLLHSPMQQTTPSVPVGCFRSA